MLQHGKLARATAERASKTLACQTRVLEAGSAGFAPASPSAPGEDCDLHLDLQFERPDCPDCPACPKCPECPHSLAIAKHQLDRHLLLMREEMTIAPAHFFGLVPEPLVDDPLVDVLGSAI